MTSSVTALASRFQFFQLMDRGSFGDIYLGIDRHTQAKVVAKVESVAGTKFPQLEHEYNVYQQLTDMEGVPRVHCFDVSANYRVLVLDMLGDNLEKLFVAAHRRFSLRTVLMIGLQALDRLQALHDRNYLHRDIKPDNFLLGTGEHAGRIYLIDMGLSKSFRDDKTRKHIAFRDHKKLTGTPRYASMNVHLGLEHGRRDDLESLGYVMIYLLNGHLPWQGLKASTKQEKYNLIGKCKLNTSIDTLCAGQPTAFVKYFQHCRDLDFAAEPNYTYLRKLLRDLFQERQFVDDGRFDSISASASSSSASPASSSSASPASAAAVAFSAAFAIMLAPPPPAVTYKANRTNTGCGTDSLPLCFNDLAGASSNAVCTEPSASSKAVCAEPSASSNAVCTEPSASSNNACAEPSDEPEPGAVTVLGKRKSLRKAANTQSKAGRKK